MAESTGDPSPGAYGAGLPAGTTVGKYRVIRRIGEGGMATIYLASSVGPGGFTKQCALKLVRAEFVGRDAMSRMLATEARVAAALNHPNIVQVFDFGRLGPSYFMAMEWVEGVSLGHVMSRMMKQRQRIALDKVAYIVSSIAEALAYLREGVEVDGQIRPLVHRDVSPSNVLLSHAGSVKLTDFGVVKLLDAAQETKTGVVKGKYAYMSPEQLRGEHVDHRADLFSLGVLLFELLTMARLFQRKTTAGTIAAVHAARVPPPSTLWDDIPGELDTLVLRLTARRREDRLDDATEVVRALQPFLSHSARAELAGDVRLLSADSARPSLGPASRSVDDALPSVGADEFEALEEIEGDGRTTPVGDPAIVAWVDDEDVGDIAPVKRSTPTGADFDSAPKAAMSDAPRTSSLALVVAAAASVAIVGTVAWLLLDRRAPAAGHASDVRIVASPDRTAEPAAPIVQTATRARPSPTQAAAVATEQPVAQVPEQAPPPPAAASPPPPVADVARAEAKPARRATRVTARAPAAAPTGSAQDPGLASADDIEASGRGKANGTSVDGTVLADEDDVERADTRAARKPKAATVGDVLIAEDYD